MSDHIEAVERLKEAGYRLTPQRVMVLSVLGDQEGPLGVGEIFEGIKKVYSFVDVATVYRSLKLLTKLHLVTEIRIGDSVQYELVRMNNRHFHMVCEECGTTFHLAPDYLDDFKERLKREVGFEPHMEHFTISGLCTPCSQTAGHAHPHSASVPS